MKPVLQSIVSAAVFAVAVQAFAGEVTGKIVFEGKVPPMRAIDMSADAKCMQLHGDKEIKREDLVVGDGQTMANVVVYITKGLPEKEHAAPSDPVVLTQKDCVYQPHVFVAQVGQTIRILNPDGIGHNVNANPRINAPFNRMMAASVEEMEVTFDKVETDGFRVECNIHPWMRAYCVVLDHPYHDVTGLDGTFKIEGLEPGTYEIGAWHERLGLQTAEVTIEEGKPAEANFSFSVPKRN